MNSLLPFFAVAIITASSLPLLHPAPWAEFGPVNLQRLLASEFDWQVGTTVTYEFLPARAASPPAAQPALLESYKSGRVDKVNRATLPAGAQVDIVAHGPRHDQLAVTSPSDFVLRLYTFDFPGWRAYVDGQPVPITPSEPEGWITFPVPAGSHAVLVRFEETPARLAGWALTGVAALVCAGVMAGRWRRSRSRPVVPRPPNGSHPGEPQAGAPLGLRQAAGLGLLLALGFGLAAWYQPPGGWHAAARQRSGLPAPQHPVGARLESNLALLGFNLSQGTVRPGEAVTVTLQWQATAPVTANLRVFVHMIGPDGQLWGQSDKFHPGRYAEWPTGRWPVGYSVADEHQVALAPETPPGQYRLYAGLWDGLSGRRMRQQDGAGQPTGPDAILLLDDFVVAAVTQE